MAKIVIFNTNIEDIMIYLNKQIKIEVTHKERSERGEDKFYAKIGDTDIFFEEVVGFIGEFVYTSVTGPKNVIAEILNVLKQVAKHKPESKILLDGEFEKNSDSAEILPITKLGILIKISRLKMIRYALKLLAVVSIMLFLIYSAEIITLNLDLIYTPYGKPDPYSIIQSLIVTIAIVSLWIIFSKYYLSLERNI